MKRIVLSTTSAIVFSVLALAAMPSGAMAEQPTVADFEKEVQANIAFQEAKSLEGLTGFDRLKQEQYNALVREAWNELIRERKAYDSATDKTGLTPPPTAPNLNEAQLRGQAEVRAQAIWTNAQNAQAQLNLQQYNQKSAEIIEQQSARDAAWKAAANATLEQLTQQAIAKGINQSSYDSFIEKAMGELYAARLVLNGDPSLPMPSIIATPEALQLLSQMESVKSYAAAHPDMCQGNPYSCGIVDKRTTVETAHPATNQSTNTATSSNTPITISLPAVGEVKNLANGYTVDGNGLIKDATGKAVATLTDAGKFVDVNGNAVTADVANQYVSLFSSTGITTGGGSGGGAGKAYAQQNSYVAATDKGEFVAIDESGSVKTAQNNVKKAPAGVITAKVGGSGTIGSGTKMQPVDSIYADMLSEVGLSSQITNTIYSDSMYHDGQALDIARVTNLIIGELNSQMLAKRAKLTSDQQIALDAAVAERARAMATSMNNTYQIRLKGESDPNPQDTANKQYWQSWSKGHTPESWSGTQEEFADYMYKTQKGADQGYDCGSSASLSSPTGRALCAQGKDPASLAKKDLIARGVLNPDGTVNMDYSPPATGTAAGIRPSTDLPPPVTQ